MDHAKVNCFGTFGELFRIIRAQRRSAFTLIRPSATFSLSEKELNGTRLAKLPLPAGEGGVRENANVF